LDEDETKVFMESAPEVFHREAAVTSSTLNARESAAAEVVFFPASFGQQRLWFIDQLTPGRATYNIPSALRIGGELKVEVLERALAEVARRHETLRTRFVAVGGELQQVIEDEVKVELPVLDLTCAGGEEEREAEAMRLALEEAQQPFDLQQAPLFRGNLLRLGALNHVLLFTMHHIISDAWSIGILAEEVSVLYGAFSAGRPSPLPELSIQYADYSVWQRECLEGGVLERQLAYWKQQLGGSGMLMLPTDRPRPAVQSQNGATCDFVIAANLTRELKKLAEEQGATLFMVLVAALQTLLYRYSGQNDIAVGTPIAGRRSSETERLIGFFINTLVLRVDLSGAPSFTELLQRTKEVTLEAFAHQDVPFEKLVEVLSPERDLDRTPLFQVMIVLQNTPQSDLRLGAATLRPFNPVDNGTSKFDLRLEFGEDESGMLISSLRYNTDLFEVETMIRMVEQCQTLLANIAADPGQAIGSYLLLPQAAYQRLLDDWNQPLEQEESTLDLETYRSHKPFPFVHEMFRQIGEQHPDLMAINSSDGDLTYSQLDQRSSGIAARLRSAGVSNNDLVAVCADSRKCIIECVLGILQAGAAFVPLSPSIPIKRLEALLAECTPKWALVEPEVAERFHSLAIEHPIEIISPDPEREPGLHGVRESSGESRGDDLSYIFFTSGSTGNPKAIAGRLKAIDHFIRWEINTFGIGPGTRVSQLMSPMFDAFMRDIFTPLCSGGTVCIPPSHEVLLDGRQLGKWIREERIAVVHTVPSLFRTIVNHSNGDGGWPDLRYVLLSGEPILPSDVKKWHELVGSHGPRLVNLYGPSETTMTKFVYMVNESDQSRRVVPVGRPMTGAKAVAVGEGGRVCAAGTVGELYIRTPFRSLGYHGRPALTAEVFVQNPFSQDAGDFVYKTGDLARPTGDGNFELVGRRDHQVKIRGVRIELAEVEKAVSECPGVGQAVVIAREDTPGDKQLVAYIVTNEGAQLNVAGMRDYLTRRLPDYMIPSAWVMLEEMPLTSNGKADRKALEAMVPEAGHQVEGADMEGRTPVEETLCDIWRQVLKLAFVGVHDDFFQLGGHSLLIAQVISRIKTAFAIEMPLSALFEAPTVAKMAKYLAARSRHEERPPSSPILVGIQPQGSRTPFFCVHPVGGQVISYGELSQELGQDQPFYGLQSPPPDFFLESSPSIEQMAALYNREIRSVQPVGPYLLSGWSMGGLVAWEMAQQLIKEGEAIGLLALIDTKPPSKYREADDRSDEMSMLAGFASDMSRLVGKDPRPLAEQFSQAAPQDQWNMVQETLTSYGVLAPKTAHAEMTALLNVFTRNALAMNNYFLHPTDQSVVFFRASETSERLSKSWTTWAGGGIQFHSVPGDHFTMLRRPNVHIIAEVLQRQMSALGQPRRRPPLGVRKQTPAS
jgi:amino acid adenylation domain-containing protein